MGSRLSKVLGPHEAAALPATARGTQSDNDNTRQDSSTSTTASDQLKVPRFVSLDDLSIATSTPTLNLRRQNSAPTSSMSLTRPPIASGLAHASEEFLRTIVLEAREPPPTSPPLPQTILPLPPPPLPETQAAKDPPQCLTCCTPLPSESDPEYSKKATKPCRQCDWPICTSCLKNMFLTACDDLTRMPPRCCSRIDLSLARHLLSQEEILRFRAKYEEWSTPQPFYCPVPVCSVFIPERLLPEQLRTRSKGKQRADSAVGTPSTKTFSCPKCVADICVGCRQQAHPDINCEIKEFGLDPETAAIFKAWGYRQCPRCGHGIRRMYGCSHMACICGAQFCWRCLQQKNICDRDGCPRTYDDNSDDSDNENGPDSPEEEEEEEEEQASTGNGAQGVDANNEQPPRRPRNLDGGSHRYWEYQDVDFGDEPEGRDQVDIWACDHDFTLHEVTLSDALQKAHVKSAMECERCWKPIYPSITTPHKALHHTANVEQMVPANGTRHRQGITPHRGILRRRPRPNYVPPRGLFTYHGTIGTAGHLTTTFETPLAQSIPPLEVASIGEVNPSQLITDTHGGVVPMESILYDTSMINTPLSQSVPTRELAPIHDPEFKQIITDTYGNVLSATPAPIPRRASLPERYSVDFDMMHNEEMDTSSAKDSIFAQADQTFSFAHECSDCGMIVCKTCRDEVSRKDEEEMEEDKPTVQAIPDEQVNPVTEEIPEEQVTTATAAAP